MSDTPIIDRIQLWVGLGLLAIVGCGLVAFAGWAGYCAYVARGIMAERTARADWLTVLAGRLRPVELPPPNAQPPAKPLGEVCTGLEPRPTASSTLLAYTPPRGHLTYVLAYPSTTAHLTGAPKLDGFGETWKRTINWGPSRRGELVAQTVNLETMPPVGSIAYVAGLSKPTGSGVHVEWDHGVAGAVHGGAQRVFVELRRVSDLSIACAGWVDAAPPSRISSMGMGHDWQSAQKDAASWHAVASAAEGAMEGAIERAAFGALGIHVDYSE